MLCIFRGPHFNAALVPFINRTLDLVGACLFQAGVVETTKKLVGFKRPLFLANCLPDVNKDCTNQDFMEDSEMSFPSGHASQAFVSATYFTMYMAWVMYSRTRGNMKELNTR